MRACAHASTRPRVRRAGSSMPLIGTPSDRRGALAHRVSVRISTRLRPFELLARAPAKNTVEIRELGFGTRGALGPLVQKHPTSNAGIGRAQLCGVTHRGQYEDSPVLASQDVPFVR